MCPKPAIPAREEARGRLTTAQTSQTRLSLRRKSKGAAQILIPSRKMRVKQRNKDANTFSVSHSKHIHQPATVPLNLKEGGDKIKK